MLSDNYKDAWTLLIHPRPHHAQPCAAGGPHRLESARSGSPQVEIQNGRQKGAYSKACLDWKGTEHKFSCHWVPP